MKDSFADESVRNRLILAALSELEEAGAGNFSLRRVAEAAGVSCAAPYRHFADKEELIRATIAYVAEDWKLFCEQIFAVTDDEVERIRAVLRSGVHFWIASGDFRSVLLYGAGEGAKCNMHDINAPIIRATDAFCVKNGLSDPERDLLGKSVLSRFYGAVMMISGGSSSASDVLDSIDVMISRELSFYKNK